MSDHVSSPARPRAKTRARPTLVTERDREILAFVAEHRIVLAAHVQTLLRTSGAFAYRRLAGLTARGLLGHSRILHGEPGWYQITRSGLALIGSDLPAPRLDLRCYRHDLGAAWLWLAAARGAFGRVERIVSEREMRSRDGASATTGSGAVAAAEVEAPGGATPPFGVHLGGIGPGGKVRLHYPDLLLIGTADERVAVELELSAKGGRRLEAILGGYGADPGIAAVLYVSDKPGIRREVRGAAARLGISHLVHVQPFAPPAVTGARGTDRSLARTAPARADSPHRPEPAPRPARRTADRAQLAPAPRPAVHEGLAR